MKRITKLEKKTWERKLLNGRRRTRVGSIVGQENIEKLKGKTLVIKIKEEIDLLSSVDERRREGK